MPATLNDDKVWFDERRKLDNICADAATARGSGHPVVILSHFEATIARLATLLREKEINYERFAPMTPAELCVSGQGRLWLGLARAFQVGYQMTSPSPSALLEIFVAEHHPMYSRDQEIIDALGVLACNAKISFYFSLEDPVMKHFGAEGVRAMFRRLGIDEDECLSHHLINMAVRTAQEKIERKVGKDLPAHSPADWFRYNLHEN